MCSPLQVLSRELVRKTLRSQLTSLGLRQAARECRPDGGLRGSLACQSIENGGRFRQLTVTCQSKGPDEIEALAIARIERCLGQTIGRGIGCAGLARFKLDSGQLRSQSCLQCWRILIQNPVAGPQFLSCA